MKIPSTKGIKGSDVGLVLKDKKAPLLGDRAKLFGPAVECCGTFMKLSSELPNRRADGLTSYYSFDCTHCGAMVDVEIVLKQREGCYRCDGKRCQTDDGHLGDDGGYLA